VRGSETARDRPAPSMPRVARQQRRRVQYRPHYQAGYSKKLWGLPTGSISACKARVSVGVYLALHSGMPVMQTRCPKCSTIVRSNGSRWEILNGDCSELLRTKWKDNPEFCPTISRVVEPDVLLPGVTSRAGVEEEIERERLAMCDVAASESMKMPRGCGS